jgi:hydroxymethylbilane synthase
VPFKNYLVLQNHQRKILMTDKIHLGTRGSELALWQTNHVKILLEKQYPNIVIDVQAIKTTGDRILDAPLSKIGDKGLFTKELEIALLDKRIDLAVHSLKDIPTSIPDGLAIAAILKREDVHDVFIANPKNAYRSLINLPKNATIATGSLRRKCQILSVRPDIQIFDIRGNLNTRMKKLDESNWDGMILAKAGVTRLGLSNRITEVLQFEIMLPAVGQGALAIEIRGGDNRIEEILRTLHHIPTATAVTAERALLRHLEGGCQIPIGAHGQINRNELRLDAVIGSLDGKRIVRGMKNGKVTDAERIGIELAEELLRRGGKEILEEIRNATKL